VKRSRTASSPDPLVCPLCGSGELRPVGHDSARCTSCSGSVGGWPLELLCQVAALPEALGGHACECGHPEMRPLPDRVFHCLACVSEVLPLHEARIHAAATDLRMQHPSSPRTSTAASLRKEVWR
jgi:hypothetical protein